MSLATPHPSTVQHLLWMFLEYKHMCPYSRVWIAELMSKQVFPASQEALRIACWARSVGDLQQPGWDRTWKLSLFPLKSRSGIFSPTVWASGSPEMLTRIILSFKELKFLGVWALPPW